MLARRLRRRPNINPALGQCIVFAGAGFENNVWNFSQRGRLMLDTVSGGFIYFCYVGSAYWYRDVD